MFQFTEIEIENYRKKLLDLPELLEQITKYSKEIIETPLIVPEKGIGNWGLYYYCPTCSIPLQFNRSDGHNHICNKCNTVYTGEPYDGAWWGTINGMNSGNAYRMGLNYMLTGEVIYGRKAVEIMLEYSKYYKDYEVHGDIPYNGPGKANAQTLDEASFIRNLLLAYDLVGDTMSADEKDRMIDQIFLPAAQFLIEHRHNQIHNHEVITNSAIAIAGLILGKNEYVQFAVYEPYGLLYQLERGVLQNKMWFEGTFGYHFYALLNFIAYEKFAINTSHSLIKHPNYSDMLELPLNYVEPDYSLPMLNDTTFGHGGLHDKFIYEFAYRELRNEKFIPIINLIRKKHGNINLETFLYGVEDIPEAKHTLTYYHTDVGYPGHTILRGEKDRYLIFKHDTYGGEHDHYDRLAISYICNGERIAPDLGTTGYGAPLHYDYYKNSGSHNTVIIGEENQAPSSAVLTRYEEIEDITYVEAMVDWGAPYVMPDSFSIRQWDEESYRNVRMARKIAWAKDYFVELFIVDGVENRTIDWTMLFAGSRIDIKENEEENVDSLSEKKPLKHLRDIKRQKNRRNGFQRFRVGKTITDMYSYVMNHDVYHAKGPDNPSFNDVSYVIERVRGQKAIFMHLVNTYDVQSSITEVEFKVNETEASVTFKLEGVSKTIRFTCDIPNTIEKGNKKDDSSE